MSYFSQAHLAIKETISLHLWLISSYTLHCSKLVFWIFLETSIITRVLKSSQICFFLRQKKKILLCSAWASRTVAGPLKPYLLAWLWVWGSDQRWGWFLFTLPSVSKIKQNLNLNIHIYLFLGFWVWEVLCRRAHSKFTLSLEIKEIDILFSIT